MSDEVSALKQVIKDMASDHEDIRRAGRWALVFEIGNMLMQRGAWCPPLSPEKDNYADIITALGIEFSKLDRRVIEAENKMRNAYELIVARHGLLLDTTPDIELPHIRDFMARILQDMRIWPDRYRELCNQILQEELEG